uniref:Uncharacterized protein n=1 Tax=Anopheles christyi TaxID=43041 RepID=A0A182KI52_9DIPT
MSGYSSKMSNCSSTWSIRAMIFLNFGCAQLSASFAGGSSPGCCGKGESNQNETQSWLRLFRIRSRSTPCL